MRADLKKPDSSDKHFSLPSGVLVINKPKGMVSKDVSRVIERHYRGVKIGHVGTLDPMAEGVLPLLVGRATRTQDLLHRGLKAYEFDIEFGFETDTLDTEGQIVMSHAAPSFTSFEIEAVLPQLVGRQRQVPPIFSAVKWKGRPLYEYARSGRADEVPLEKLAKDIQVASLEFLGAVDNRASFRVSCSSGTYVRSLGQSIAHKLGTIATTSRIVRVFSSGFPIESAISFEKVESCISSLRSLILPLKDLPFTVPRLYISDSFSQKKLWMGQKLSVDRTSPSLVNDGKYSHFDSVILTDCDGQVFGIGRCEESAGNQFSISMKRGLV